MCQIKCKKKNTMLILLSNIKVYDQLKLKTKINHHTGVIHSSMLTRSNDQKLRL